MKMQNAEITIGTWFRNGFASMTRDANEAARSRCALEKRVEICR